MKKITITIETENAAFENDLGYELGRILSELAEKVKNDNIPSTLRDICGNSIGTIETE